MPITKRSQRKHLMPSTEQRNLGHLFEELSDCASSGAAFAADLIATAEHD
jgi:hypothetical protein